jgi:putative transcriptional regulator
MTPLTGMSLSRYRKREQGQRRVSGPAAALLRVIEREPEAVKRALGEGEIVRGILALYASYPIALGG